MGLLRVLFWLVLLGAAFWILRRWWRGDARPKHKARPQITQPMVRCAHCGVHVPQERAVADAEGRLWFCSPDHRRLQHAAKS